MKRPKMSGQCCGNCKWLDAMNMSITNHKPPRWKPGSVGECKWPALSVKLPISITYYADRDLRQRCPMWPHNTGCLTWEPMEELDEKK
jgi:hypothetical protein